MPKTPNHGYNVPSAGAQDWHVPLNENFEQYDTDIEIRDTAGNRGDYEPKDGAKFLATDTEEVFVGDGSSWTKLETTGATPSLTQLNPDGDFLGIGRSSAMSFTEVFGLQRDGASGEYGGMYINTAHSDGRPYYAYANQGSEIVWHYYDAGDDTWKLDNAGVGLSLTDSHHVGVGTESPGMPLDVAGQNNWDLDSGDGDVRIGSEEYRLAIGVAQGGGGAGAANVRAKGGIKRLNLGAGTSGHTVQIDEGSATVNGDFDVSGNKNFVQAVDTDDGEREVVYTASEAPTPRTECSGVAELEDGRVEIDLPEHFAWVTSSDEPVVAQVTAHASEPVRPQVTERSTERVVVEDFGDGAGEYEVSYTVRGTRAGHEDKPVVREPESGSGDAPPELGLGDASAGSGGTTDGGTTDRRHST